MNAEVFAVFYDIKVMKAEVYAKGFEKCRLLTTLLGQNVENLHDYGCSKIQDLVGEGKANSSRICLATLSDTKQGFAVPRGKQRCMEAGQCNI